jgi:hypothetical protein
LELKGIVRREREMVRGYRGGVRREILFREILFRVVWVV